MTNTQFHPLTGVRVLDVATMLAAPFCATILGEFGADVIKVEMPGQGDALRRTGTMTEAGATYTWLNDNRNKKSITLDLRKPEGKDIFRRLIADSDIVTENFRPGTLERWDLGYETLKKIKKDIILIRISAYGQDGPYRDRPGFARLAHGFSGLSYLTGEPNGPPLVPGSGALGDYLAGMWGAIGALLAYTALKRHGIGQYVDVSLFEGIFRMLDEVAPSYSRSGYIQERMGKEVPNIVPHNHYQAKDGKWVAVACSIDKMFERLANVMKRPDLLESDRFSTMAQRIVGRDEVNTIVGEWIRSMPRDEVIRHCVDAEVAVGPVYSIKDIFEDEHYRARNTLLEVKDERIGRMVIPNVFPRLSETPGKFYSLGPNLGQHNEEIYHGCLGFSHADMERLTREGVI